MSATPQAESSDDVPASGYEGTLYILAFDHRGSFTKRFGIEGDPNPEETERIAAGKHLIFEGIVAAPGRGADPSVTGALVDEQFGAPAKVPGLAKASGIKLAMPVEKSGQSEFDFEYGPDFGAHIERFDPDFSKVLVRYNPDGDGEMNRRQSERLRRLSDWLHEHDRKFLFELLVPAEEAQLAAVDGDSDRYDSELRPELMRRAIAELQRAGVEADIWKIEGVDERADCERIAAQCRAGGRERRRLRRPRSRSRRRQGGSLAAPGGPGLRLRGVRHRPVDLGRAAQGLHRRQSVARGCGGARGRQLPAVRRGLHDRRNGGTALGTFQPGRPLIRR